MVCVSADNELTCYVYNENATTDYETQEYLLKQSAKLTVRLTDTVQCLLNQISKVFEVDTSEYELFMQRSNGQELAMVPLTDKSALLKDLGIDYQPNTHLSFTIRQKDTINGDPDEQNTTIPCNSKFSESTTTFFQNNTNFPDYNTSQSEENTIEENAICIRKPVQYVGLVNQAMTCYLNSLLQALYMTPEFRNALYNWVFDGFQPDKNIPYQLQKLFVNLQTSAKSAVETTELTKSFGWDMSEAWQQHDIQELCRVMFDALEQKFKDTAQSDLINRLYQGEMIDYVKCLECQTEKSRVDTFLDIPLPVRPFGSAVAYSSVQDALQAFVQPETLDGNNQYFCDTCDKKCDAHKGLKFSKIPYLLTLHLKRFDFDYSTMHRIKLNDKVTFPETLDLNAFIWQRDSQTDKIFDDCSTTDSGSALDDENTDITHVTDTQTFTNSDPVHNYNECINKNIATSGIGSNSDLISNMEAQKYEEIDEGISLCNFHESSYEHRQENAEITKSLGKSQVKDTKIQEDPYENEKNSRFLEKHEGTSQCFNIAHKNVDETVDNSKIQQTFDEDQYENVKNSKMFGKLNENQHDHSKMLETSQGPYIYELFSIMIHSGSASGGHYYAYIKDLRLGKWFCFDDQTVSTLTYEDIQKSYGGGASKSYYSGAYSSSTNAYMLMYRQIDKKRNVNAISLDEFPSHIKKLLENLRQREETDRLIKERELEMYKIRLFVPNLAQNPQLGQHLTQNVDQNNQNSETLAENVAEDRRHNHTTQKLIQISQFLYNFGHNCQLNELKMYLHSETTLLEATEEAFRRAKLNASEISLEQCRLVNFNYQQNTIEASFDDSVHESIADIISSINPSYKLDWLLEIRAKNETFPTYKPGGIHLRIYLVDMTTEQLFGPKIVRSYERQTTNEFFEVLSTLFKNDLHNDLDRKGQNKYEKGHLDNDDNMLVAFEKMDGEKCFLLENGSAFDYVTKYIGNGRFKVFITNSAGANLVERFQKFVDKLENVLALEVLLPVNDKWTLEVLSIPALDANENCYCEQIDKDIGATGEPGGNEICSEQELSTRNHGTHAEQELSAGEHTLSTEQLALVQTMLSAAKISTACEHILSAAGVSTSGGQVISEETFSMNQTSFAGQMLSSQHVTIIRSSQVSTRNESVCTESHVSVDCQHSDEGGGGPGGGGTSASAAQHSDQSNSEDSSLSDSDRTLVGEVQEDDCLLAQISSSTSNSPHSTSEQRLSSPDESHHNLVYLDESYEQFQHFFKITANLQPHENTQNCDLTGNLLHVLVDKRTSILQLKKFLEKYVAVPLEYFKIYRQQICSGNTVQEFELTRLQDQLNTVKNFDRLVIKLGRVLKENQISGKVFQLILNSAEPIKYLCDYVITKGQSVLQAKMEILALLKKQFNVEFPKNRVRLRRKNWKAPNKIFLEHQVFGNDIPLHANWEIYLQELEGDELVTNRTQYVFFVKRWFASEMKFGPFVEVCVESASVQEFKRKVEEVSQVPAEFVEFAMLKGSFPYDMSVLGVHAELDWNSQALMLTDWPYNVYDDGSAFLYRDSREELKQLTADERKEIINKESSKIGNTRYSKSNLYSPRKERALKIYLDTSPKKNEQSTEEVD